MIFLRMLSDLPRKPEDLRCHLLVGRVFSGWGDVETKQHPDSVCKKNNLPGFQDLPLLQRLLHTKKIQLYLSNGLSSMNLPSKQEHLLIFCQSFKSALASAKKLTVFSCSLWAAMISGVAPSSAAFSRSAPACTKHFTMFKWPSWAAWNLWQAIFSTKKRGVHKTKFGTSFTIGEGGKRLCKKKYEEITA